MSLALPVVHAAASRRLLDEGVLLTRGESIQDLNAIDTVIFDKTGTLTRGVPEIIETHVNPERSGLDMESVLAIACALEANSAHPIAHAFLSAHGPGELQRAEQVEVFPAQGLEGQVGGVSWRIGTAAFCPGSCSTTLQTNRSGWRTGRVGLHVSVCAIPCVRALTRRSVSFQSEGIATAILSGDSMEAVKAVAERLGIDDWAARQTPEMKLEKLEQRRALGQHVLMVGDGVNDAPVLAAADVSMTVKGGAELANSTADMILTGESLSLVLRARQIARRTRQLIRQNLTWAVLYNASVMPLAVSGMLKPWMAALGMSLSSLLVVANAARLVNENRKSNGGLEP